MTIIKKIIITIVVATKNFKLPYGSCELDRKGNLKQITKNLIRII